MFRNAITIWIEKAAAGTPGFDDIIFIVFIGLTIPVIICTVNGTSGGHRRVNSTVFIVGMPDSLFHLSPVIQQDHNVRRHLISSYRKHATIIGNTIAT